MKIFIAYTSYDDMFKAAVDSIKETAPNVELVTFYDKDKQGVTKTYNEAFKLDDDIFIFHSDMIAQEGWYEKLMKYVEANPNAGIIGTKLIYPNGILQHVGGIVGPTLSCGNAGTGELDFGQYNQPSLRPFVTFGGVFIRKQVIDKIGLLDEQFNPGYYDDVDYCFRAKEAGFDILYVPVQFIHLESQTARKLIPNEAVQKNLDYFRAKWMQKIGLT